MKRDIIIFIAAFFNHCCQFTDKINGVIVMHGEGNATSTAATVNEIVGDYIYDSFDLPISISINQLIEEIIDFIKHIDTKNGLILLVDMGSLEEMYRKIIGYVEGDLLIMNNCSTAIAIDVALKIQQSQPIDSIVKMNIEMFNVEKQYFEGISQKPNILISCLSGEGIAIKIKDIFTEYIDDSLIEVLTMDYIHLKESLLKEDTTFFKNTVAVFTTAAIPTETVPMISLEGVVNGSESLECLRIFLSSNQIKECTNAIVKLFTIEGATGRLSFLNPEKVVDEVEEVIKAYEEYYQIELVNFLRINLFLHLSLMIERILKGDQEHNEMLMNIQCDDLAFQKFLILSDTIFYKIKDKYNIEIPKNEYALIFQIIEQVSARE